MRPLSRFSTAPALLVRVAISLAALVSFGAGLTVYVSGRVPFGESLPLAGAFYHPPRPDHPPLRYRASRQRLFLLRPRRHAVRDPRPRLGVRGDRRAVCNAGRRRAAAPAAAARVAGKRGAPDRGID